MDIERWQKFKALFEAAMDQDPAQRTAFLEQACGEDHMLRRKVEALLANYSVDDSFLEKPVYQEIPDLFESGIQDTFSGRQLGPYWINRKLGQGGMGIVYLARDTRLDRPVAIKMLAPQYTRSPQHRERLRREAQAAARLSHPGIATVYSLEEIEDNLYIVTEYVPGNTLRQDMRGVPLSTSLLMDVAVQIAQALTAAHEQGIVHRDLKPENAIRTHEGIVKILDFGLARFQILSQDILPPNKPLTQTGMFLGTPAYASPEQLLGVEVDFRTDIFSFGVVLYELATGKHPFYSPDPVSVIARILEWEVMDLTQVNPAIPVSFDRIVRTCLRKKPTERFEKTRHLLNELEKLHDSDAGSGPLTLRKEASGLPTDRKISAIWWWQFHQAVAGFGYYAMLYPLWRVKKWFDGVEGSLLFFPALIAVGMAANLRLHLWFTSKFYPDELARQRRKVACWIRWADILFVFMLAVSAILIHSAHAVIATLLMAVAIGSLVAFSMIEPTTTKAAMNHKETR